MQSDCIVCLPNLVLIAQVVFLFEHKHTKAQEAGASARATLNDASGDGVPCMWAW